MGYRPIRNSAQLSPSAVRFQMRLPDAKLASFASDFWQYDVLVPHAYARIQVFPSGCVVMRFDISADDVKPVAYGPSLRPDMKSVFIAGRSAFGVAFRLENARSVVGCAISELCDQRLDLDQLWPGETDEICYRLWRGQDFEERVAVLTSILRRRICERRMPHADFLRAVRCLGDGIDTSALPRDLGLSERTLRRHFERCIGLSPKQVARIMRVQKAMQALIVSPGTPRSRLALEAGFSDQPHFNREFKRLLGMSPGAFTRYVGRFHEPTLPIWKRLNRHMTGGQFEGFSRTPPRRPQRRRSPGSSLRR